MLSVIIFNWHSRRVRCNQNRPQQNSTGATQPLRWCRIEISLNFNSCLKQLFTMQPIIWINQLKYLIATLKIHTHNHLNCKRATSVTSVCILLILPMPRQLARLKSSIIADEKPVFKSVQTNYVLVRKLHIEIICQLRLRTHDDVVHFCHRKTSMVLSSVVESIKSSGTNRLNRLPWHVLQFMK